MRIRSIESGTFKLDGGAMFGIVPKKLWAKLNPPDPSNMCTWSLRCLLLETGERKVLFDTGIGNKQDEKFRKHFEPAGQDQLLFNLALEGVKPEDITDVFLTHFHFDHVGGALSRTEDGTFLPTFPNAVYWTNARHLQWATRPNAREAASFLPENFLPLQAMGRLSFIEPSKEDVEWIPGVTLRFVYGHTEAMMIPFIHTPDKTLVYCADLMPSVNHIGLPYIMAYDVRPLITLEEKERLLTEAASQGHVLLFEHDHQIEAAEIGKGSNGKFAVERSGKLQDLLSFSE